MFVSVTEFEKQQQSKMDPFASYKVKTEVHRFIHTCIHTPCCPTCYLRLQEWRRMQYVATWISIGTGISVLGMTSLSYGEMEGFTLGRLIFSVAPRHY